MFTKAVVTFAAIVVMSVSAFKEDIFVPMPYSFGYKIKDKHGEQYREETGDGKEVVKGSYGFIDDKGIKRDVVYVADKAGFRAEIKTNEPGTASQEPAAVKIISTVPDGAAGLALGFGAAGFEEGLGLGGGVPFIF